MVDREWVDERLSEAFKLKLKHRLKTRLGVFVTPPVKPPDEVEFGDLTVMLNMDRFDPATVDPFLELG